MGFPFLNFPPEIREQVYHHLLCSASSRQDTGLGDGSAHYDFKLDILLTNRQIHHEAKKVFQDNIFVKITTPWPEALGHISSEGKVPIVAAGSNAATFKDFHLWVFIETPPDNFVHGTYSMLICLEDLDLFTRTWRYSNLNHPGLNTHLCLKLTLQDPHVPDRKIPKTLQTRLLIPFGDIKDLQSFVVQGQRLLPSVKETLTKAQAEPEPTLEQCLERATSLKEDGNKAMQSGEYREALQTYIEAFAAIHIRVQGRSRHIYADGYYVREVVSGVYKGERGDYIRMVLRIKLVANVILAYLKLENWTEAHFWGKRSIVLFRQGMTGSLSQEIEDDVSPSWAADAATMNIPAKPEMGKIFYRTALASRALGKTADVTTLITAAAIYLPYDATVQAAKRALDG